MCSTSHERCIFLIWLDQLHLMSCIYVHAPHVLVCLSSLPVIQTCAKPKADPTMPPTSTHHVVAWTLASQLSDLLCTHLQIAWSTMDEVCGLETRLRVVPCRRTALEGVLCSPKTITVNWANYSDNLAVKGIMQYISPRRHHDADIPRENQVFHRVAVSCSLHTVVTLLSFVYKVARWYYQYLRS